MSKKRISIFAAGQRFTILTEEDEKYVLEIASRVDARISSLTVSQGINRERAAVLTALDFADDNEQDKRAIAEIKEQIKDYVTEIARLTEENQRLSADNQQMKKNASALKDAEKAKAQDEKEIEALKAQVLALKEQIELMNAKAEEEKAQEEVIPLPDEAPEEKEQITAEDDLFFEEPEEPVIKPVKEKKNRHEHQHVNPYKQQYMQKKNEQKGYTQQRQYSLFEKDE